MQHHLTQVWLSCFCLGLINEYAHHNHLQYTIMEEVSLEIYLKTSVMREVSLEIKPHEYYLFDEMTN